MWKIFMQENVEKIIPELKFFHNFEIGECLAIFESDQIFELEG